MSQHSAAAPQRPGHRAWWRRLSVTGLPAVVVLAGSAPMLVHAGAPATMPKGVLCQGFASCNARGYDSYGYGAHWKHMYWRMFPGNNCTNYAAFVEKTVYDVRQPRYLLGNGGSWAATARAHRVRVNHVPSVGAVAEWGYGTPGIPAGHVAVVEKVGPHGSYILVSQDGMSAANDGYDWVRIVRGRSGQFQPWPGYFIHFTIPVRAVVGYFRPKALKVYVRDSRTAGPVDTSARLGVPGSVPLTGDWRGNGADGMAYYNPAFGTFRVLGAGSSRRHPNVVFKYGPVRTAHQPGMIPLVGDWKGTGRDGVGYYDPATGTFHLRQSLGAGADYRTFRFGPPHMIPLTGNWTGGRHDGVGYYNPRTGMVRLRVALSAGPPFRTFHLKAHRIPIAGNWLGGPVDHVGYYDQWNGTFHLFRGLGGKVLAVFRFGPKRAVPLTGDWFGYPRA